VHSFLESMPIMGASALGCLRWRQAPGRVHVMRGGCAGRKNRYRQAISPPSAPASWSQSRSPMAKSFTAASPRPISARAQN